MIRFAKGVSILTHPVFAPIYLLILLFLKIGLFENQSASISYVIIFFGATLVLLPLTMVFLFHRFNFISEISRPTKRDRIFMLLIMIFFYAFNLYLWFEKNPNFLFIFLFVILLVTTALAFIINFFFNISLHAMAQGGILGFYVIMCKITLTFSLPLLAAIILIGGIAGSARLILKAHKPREVYIGYLCGLLAVLIIGNILY